MKHSVSTIFRAHALYQVVENEFLPLDKGHVPENLWKLSVIYLFEDIDFPIAGL